MTDADPAILSAAERAYVRGELDAFFSTLPSVAQGFILKVWKSGPLEGKPKVPATAQGMIDRGLLRLDTTERFPRLFFTEPGLAALRRMMADKRFADPTKFGHIRRVRIPMHPAHPYRTEAAHRSEVMAPTVPISSRPPF